MFRLKIRLFYVGSMLFLPMYSGISIVYNLRVAETSKHLGGDKKLPRPSIGSVTAFGTWRESYNGIKQNSEGGLFTLAYVPESFFLRVDAAFGRVASCNQGVFFSRVQADDLLFSGGYSPSISDKVRFTVSGLVGIPTHQETSLQHIQFGYGHYGIGAQLDGSFVCSRTHDYVLRCATRLVHFFPRQTFADLTTNFAWYKFGLGSVADLYIALNHKKGRHGMEIGYDASILFDAYVCPSVSALVGKFDGIRNSFYGAYRYGFLVNQRIHAVSAAISYGFDSKPKDIGLKRVITAWVAWGLNF